MQTNTLPAQLLEPLQPFVHRVEKSLDSLAEDRVEFLKGIAEDIDQRLEKDGKAELTFICTHNSRRSHLSQVWCQVAAAHYGVPGVQTYSGGTEATACNIRTVRAFWRAGLSIAATTQGDNPIYLVQYAETLPPMRVFSKVYDQDTNPSKGFIAMMCCSDADENCPLVRGASGRYPLHYEDPKAADGTPAESGRYDERCYQIAQEMFYIIREVSRLRKS